MSAIQFTISENLTAFDNLCAVEIFFTTVFALVGNPGSN